MEKQLGEEEKPLHLRKSNSSEDESTFNGRGMRRGSPRGGGTVLKASKRGSRESN